MEHRLNQLNVTKMSGAFIAITFAGQATELSGNGTHTQICQTSTLRLSIFKGLWVQDFAYG
jgi:hypothetical protein